MKRTIIATVAAAGLAFSAASVSAQGTETSEPEEMRGGAEAPQPEMQQEPGAMPGSETMRGSEQQAPSELRSEGREDASGMTGPSGEYVVQEGDTLGKIAEKKLGSAAKWRALAEANDIHNPDALEIGQRLKIPEHSGSMDKPSSMRETESKLQAESPEEHSSMPASPDRGAPDTGASPPRESDRPY